RPSGRSQVRRGTAYMSPLAVGFFLFSVPQRSPDPISRVAFPLASPRPAPCKGAPGFGRWSGRSAPVRLELPAGNAVLPGRSGNPPVHFDTAGRRDLRLDGWHSLIPPRRRGAPALCRKRPEHSRLPPVKPERFVHSE